MKLPKSLSPLTLSLLVALLFSAPLPLRAAVDMYMTIDGISGESQTYKGAIDLLSVSNELAVIIDAKSNLPGKLSISDIWFTKYIDRASPELLSYLATGGTGKNATITVNRIGSTGPFPYWKVELKYITLTSIQQNLTGADSRGTEKVSLSFGQVLVTYTDSYGITTSGGFDSTECVPQTEVCDGVDNDCDGAIDEALADDGTATTCGQGDCAFSGVLSCENGAWIDSCVPGTPSAEICDGRDNNCDGQIDEGVKTTYSRDADGDTYGTSAETSQACTPPVGYVSDNTDCDDSRPDVHPGATESCDGIDNNCDDQIDEGAKTTYYRDADGDTYGTSAVTAQACTLPAGYVANKTDCNDANPGVNPGVPEILDGIDNNCNGQIDEGFVASVDLTISAITAPAKTAPGAVITVGHTTKNSGPDVSGASTTKFYWSTNATWESSDTLLGSQTVPALAAAATFSGSLAVTVPASGCSGTFYIIAKADADAVVIEKSETNNIRSKATKTGADLIVSAVTGPTTSGAGRTITVGGTTKNNGGCPAGAFTTNVYLSPNNTWDAADVSLGSLSVAGLAAGATDTGTISATIPAGTASGTFYLIAKADVDNVVPELVETNNAKAKSIKLGPDLIVSSLKAPTTAARGTNIAITEAAKNNGGGLAGASTTRIYLSTNTTYDAGDLLLGSRSVPALNALASDLATTTVTIPADITAGSYYLLVVVDAAGAVTETIETNNTKNKALTVN